MGVVVRPLECGWLSTPAGDLVSGQQGQARVPVAAFLVEHPKGRLVFDTGMHPELRSSTARLRSVAESFAIEIDTADLLGARLRDVDCDPADVELAVLSHLHFDHCGGLCELPAARVLVHRAEWAAAQNPGLIEYGVYNPDDHDLGHDHLLLEGEHDVFGDGSVVVVPTPGHTPGHQSLRIEGRLLLVGDACYCRLALDLDALPAYAHDADRQRATFAWLRAQEASGVDLVFSHDAEQWSTRPDTL